MWQAIQLLDDVMMTMMDWEWDQRTLLEKSHDSLMMETSKEPSYHMTNDGYTELGLAVKDQDEDKVHTLIKEGVEVDAVDFYDRTPLQYAATVGNETLTLLLINQGSCIDWTDGYGVSALHIAACRGHANIVNLLISHDCVVDIQNPNSLSALHCAAANGHADVVQLLLKKGVRCNVQEPSKRTPLFMAADAGHLNVIQQLLAAKARINLSNDIGMTPLHIAVMNCHTEAARLLIAKSARVSECDHKNNIPLHYAVRTRNVTLVRELLLAGSQKNSMSKLFESPVHIAVRMGHTEILQVLVKHGCDVNIYDPVGNVTPLHLAVNHHQDFSLFYKIFEILLGGGVHLNCRAFSTLETPLYRAVDMRKTEIAELLLIHGADPNLACPFDVSALQKACQRENVHLVNLLLHCGIIWKKERWIQRSQVGSVAQNSEINSLLQNWKQNPLSLQRSCRVSIRRTLGENLKHKINQLGLPRRLKAFCLLSDVRQFS